MEQRQAVIQELSRRIGELKEKRKAVILAHFYQRPEVQDVADFVGDSLQLAQLAAATSAEVIVFCGVYFMAESAKILSPEKIVLLPDEGAGCPLADMAAPEAVRARKESLPGCIVITYVNSSAAVKAMPPERTVLFVPDRNLGRYIANRTGRNLELWDGYCHVHDRLKDDEILAARAEHPGAPVVVHPECRSAVIDLADYVSSTAGMLKYAGTVDAPAFIIGTEQGLLHSLKKSYPDKSFYPAAAHMVCPNMKLTTLEKVRWAMEDMAPQVEVQPDVRERARQALMRMLEIV